MTHPNIELMLRQLVHGEPRFATRGLEHSIARRVRWPRTAPRAITAEIGAKNGESLTWRAMTHAAPTAIEVWAMVHAPARSRLVRWRTWPRSSGSGGRRGSRRAITSPLWRGAAAAARRYVALFSRCPPNAKRIAESMRLASSSSPREAKREYSAALSTGAGTPSSIAACAVQRPSPESDTRPEKSSSSGFLSSSSDGITGSSAIPHIGQLPGAGLLICGCIGHV